MNSEGTAFQLRMEDSREGKEDDEKGRRMPNSHVDDKKGKKAMVYKGRKGRRKGDGRGERKNTTREKKRKSHL